MNATIIGWYGTETIGDRAILAGILAVLSRMDNDLKIQLGSLFPFFSRRMVEEDALLRKKLCKKEPEITIFDSKIPKELKKAIKNSDMLIMGGGPLMHIKEMYMIDYAFKKAKEYRKKTMIFGCGIGPLHTEKYIKILFSILKNADVSYLRDQQSLKTLNSLQKNIFVSKEKRIFVSHDPAILPCLYCKENEKYLSENYVVINLRKFPMNYSKKSHQYIDKQIVTFLEKLNSLNNFKIKLVPMHYFAAGGDDRSYFYELLNQISGNTNIEVQNEPLNVENTLRIFAEAKYAVGMRYHSVLFQTVMNGNNYILDYTEPKSGKISGFIDYLSAQNFYKNRYLNIQESQNIDFHFSNEKFNLTLDYEQVVQGYKKLKEL